MLEPEPVITITWLSVGRKKQNKTSYKHKLHSLDFTLQIVFQGKRKEKRNAYKYDYNLYITAPNHPCLNQL